MGRHDRLAPSVLAGIHDAKLLEHLRWAASTVPFYRERVDADAIRGPKDLARFPILDKRAVREAGDRLRSDAWKGRLLMMETGGSSGEPLRFFSDSERESSQLACKLRARAWWGLHPGHRETDLWGSPLEVGRDAGLRRLVSGVLGLQLLPAFRLNDVTMATFRDRLKNGRTDFLYGYATALARYARYLESRGEDLADLRLRVAICTAETLLPDDRAVIGQRLAPPANEYGCRDGGLVAHEDPAGHLRLMSDAVHLEVLDEGGSPVAAGEPGEAVLTNLWARGFPLIRYRLGDRVVMAPGPIPEGLPHPVIERLEGRTTDFLIATDGTRVHALGVIYVLRETTGIARFRVVQDARDHLRILVVAGPGFDRPAAEATLTDKMKRVLGATLEVAVEEVDDLDPLPSGKHRYVICEVES